MGGVSDGSMTREMVSGRPAIRMRGEVSLENNGGFVQISLDLDPDGEPVDVSAWRGIELDVFGNNEDYTSRKTIRSAKRWDFFSIGMPKSLVSI